MKHGEGYAVGPFGEVTLVEAPAGALGSLESLLTKEFTDAGSYTIKGDVATVSLPRLDDGQKSQLSGAGFRVVRDDYQYSMF